MKKMVAVLLALITVCLCGCGNAAPKVDERDFADQAAFLEDMAKGINDRLDITDAEEGTEKNPDEQAAYETRLVDVEMKRIEKYDGLNFEDSTFDTLAHLYISACRQQRFAAENYRNKDLHSSLWSAGRTTRAAVITEMYSRYNLPLSGERAAEYAPSYTITISNSGTDDTDYSDCISMKPLEWSIDLGTIAYYHHDVLVTNESADCNLTVTLLANFYDAKGNVVGTAEDTLYYLGKGNTQLCRLQTENAFAKAEIKVESVRKGNNSTCVADDVDLKISYPKGKVMAAFTNRSGQKITSGQAWFVFYSGAKVIYVNYAGYYASSSKPLEPGETQYVEADLTKYNQYYDRLEVYFSASAG